MRSQAKKTTILCAIAVLILAVACSKEAPAPAAESPAPEVAPPAAEATTSELAGTAWRLLKLTSAAGLSEMPGDPSRYTLEFVADGRVAMAADCNRGSGSWTPGAGGRLQFGPVAATRALCPPGSISEAYLARFEAVRGYALDEGRLRLTGEAGAAALEFEPLPPVVATVLGEEIRAADAGEMQAAVLQRIFDAHAVAQGIAVEPAEIDAYIDNMNRGMAAAGLDAGADLSPEEAAEIDTMRRDMGQSLIRQWKLNRALYAQYGGRIIYQQLGPEPLDAYRQYLEERQAAGDFAIANPGYEAEFWRYFTDESIHDFMEAGGEDEARAFATPPWE